MHRLTEWFLKLTMWVWDTDAGFIILIIIYVAIMLLCWNGYWNEIYK